MKHRTPKLGQHFLTGQWAAKRLVDSLTVQPDDMILEIGPGKGALTKEILKTDAHVVAVEKDAVLVRGLLSTFANEKRLKIIESDVRDFDPETLGSYKIAANIPYYITGEIIRQFLTTSAQPRAMALLVQKEVAERIIARDKKESILSVSVKVYGTPKIVAKVSRGNFSPPPSVDSAILLIENISRSFFENLDEDGFFKIVRAGFSSKRKKLSGNLSGLFDKAVIKNVFDACSIGENTRAEDLSIEQWKNLAVRLISREVVAK